MEEVHSFSKIVRVFFPFCGRGGGGPTFTFSERSFLFSVVKVKDPDSENATVYESWKAAERRGVNVSTCCLSISNSSRFITRLDLHAGLCFLSSLVLAYLVDICGQHFPKNCLVC